MFINLFPTKINLNKSIRLDSRQNLSFKSNNVQKADSFELSSNPKTIEMSVYNPFNNSNFNGVVNIDLTKPQKIVLSETRNKRLEGKSLVLDYDPNRTDYLISKATGRKVKVAILEAKNGKAETAYIFMSPTLKKEYGYVNFTDRDSTYWYPIDYLVDTELKKDYPRQGIKGRRLIIDYLQNWNDKKIGGVGKLADKLAVKYCLEHNMKPVIVSNADVGSHVAHYLRGKRFLPIDKDFYGYNFFKQKYGTTDVNKILKKLLDQAQNSEDMEIDISDWGLVPMHMPQKLAQKYIKELKSEKK